MEFNCEKNAREEFHQAEKSLELCYNEITVKVKKEEKVLKRVTRRRPFKR